MDKLSVSDVDARVVAAPAAEGHDVACPQLGFVTNLVSCQGLFLGGSGQLDAGTLVGPLHKAGAVKAARRRPAKMIRGAEALVCPGKDDIGYGRIALGRRAVPVVLRLAAGLPNLPVIIEIFILDIKSLSIIVLAELLIAMNILAGIGRIVSFLGTACHHEGEDETEGYKSKPSTH